MTSLRFAAASLILCAAGVAQQAAQPAPPPCAGLPPGKHALLERMTAQFGLTCAQELKIEPLLHDEESVTKPLLAFPSLSADEQQAIMTTIKLAARRLIRTQLTADQQKGMDQEVDSVSQSAGKKGGGKKGGAAKTVQTVPGLAGEEALSQAVMAYAALNPDEKKAILLKLKTAARNDGALQLTADQQQKLDSEIAHLKQ
jgi:hypothetical protein